MGYKLVIIFSKSTIFIFGSLYYNILTDHSNVDTYHGVDREKQEDREEDGVSGHDDREEDDGIGHDNREEDGGSGQEDRE